MAVEEVARAAVPQLMLTARQFTALVICRFDQPCIQGRRKVLKWRPAFDPRQEASHQEDSAMKRYSQAVAALLGATMLSLGAAQAKTLVYCSEGSPEGFDPALYTAGTTFNASSRPVYSQLVEFERGTTNTIPGVAESWEVSEDGLEYTFHLRPGVKFQTTDFFTPTRDLNADDVIFTFERQRDPEHPWHGTPPAPPGNTSTACRCPTC
jgi:hypothetical protein